MNYKILVYYYLREVGSKTDNKLSKFKHIPSARQTTNPRISNASIPKICNQSTVLQRRTIIFQSCYCDVTN